MGTHIAPEPGVQPLLFTRILQRDGTILLGSFQGKEPNEAFPFAGLRAMGVEIRDLFQMLLSLRDVFQAFVDHEI